MVEIQFDPIKVGIIENLGGAAIFVLFSFFLMKISKKIISKNLGEGAIRFRGAVVLPCSSLFVLSKNGIFQ